MMSKKKLSIGKIFCVKVKFYTKLVKIDKIPGFLKILFETQGFSRFFSKFPKFQDFPGKVASLL